jgi:hypothetical protein
MKPVSLIFILSCIATVSAFVGVTTSRCIQPTHLSMFSGAGAGLPSEDNPEELAKLEQAAKTMGMTVGEYKLGISARVRLASELDAVRVSAGKTNIVTVERDGNNPPKNLVITIIEDGKSMGSKALGDELVKALKMAAESSRTKRSEAQKSMMSFIADEMKKLGMT